MTDPVNVVLLLHNLNVVFYVLGACMFVYAWQRTKNFGFILLVAPTPFFWKVIRDYTVSRFTYKILLPLFPIKTAEEAQYSVIGFMNAWLLRESVALVLFTLLQILMIFFGLRLIMKGLAKAADIAPTGTVA